MAKELPYFQFEPAEYLTKDISFCSLQAQGLFINICSYYWQRNCELTKKQLLRRLNYETELNELIDEGIIDLKDGVITIKFLDIQKEKATSKSLANSKNGSKGGAPKGNNNAKKTTEIQPKNNLNSTEKQSIREDKIIEDKIIEGKEEDKDTASPFSFYNSLLNLGADKQLSSEWLKVRKTKKATNSKTAFEAFKKQLDLSKQPINKVLELCVVNSWSGFKSDWYKEPDKPELTKQQIYEAKLKEVLKNQKD